MSMTLEEAKAISAKYEVGDIVNIPVDNTEFGQDCRRQRQAGHHPGPAGG